MVLLCLNHNYFCFRMGLFPVHILTEENMVGLRKKSKENFLLLCLTKELSWFKAQDEVHCQVYIYKQNHCLMLCGRSRILRVQLPQLSVWIFSSVTFDSSPTDCQSSSSKGERNILFPFDQLLLRERKLQC